MSNTHHAKVLQVALLPTLAIFGLYIWVYLQSPFSDFTNRLVLNGVTVFAAAFCAIMLFLLVRNFQADEPARKIWFLFAIAISLWVAGELLWAYYNLTIEEVPALSAADWFWAAGYVFLTWSILKQYQLVFPGHINRMRFIALGIWLFMLLLTTYIVVVNEPEHFWEDFLVFFYPTGDFFIAVSALALVFIFRSGQLARPWLSLFVFVVSDALYLWATTSGSYDFAMSADVTSLLVDTVYLLAYTVLGWGVFNQFLLMHFSRRS